MTKWAKLNSKCIKYTFLCDCCKKEKTEKVFSYVRWKKKYCKECKSQTHRLWREKHPGYYREYKLNHKESKTEVSQDTEIGFLLNELFKRELVIA